VFGYVVPVTSQVQEIIWTPVTVIAPGPRGAKSVSNQPTTADSGMMAWASGCIHR
jgi:hypothetical protein